MTVAISPTAKPPSLQLIDIDTDPERNELTNIESNQIKRK